MEIGNAYSYLDQLVLDVFNERKHKFKEYNLSGARLSGKTTSITIMIAKIIAIAINNDIKVAIYACRKLAKNVPELAQEIRIALDDFGISYKFVYKGTETSFPMFKFEGGSFIQIVGIINTTGKANFKGLAKAHRAKLMIDWFEEANECDKKDFQDVRLSIRGAKDHVSITSCNPDLISQYHIEYLHTMCPFNLNELKAYGQQIYKWKRVLADGSIKEGINHYTSWRVNEHIPESSKQQLEELLVMDPIKAISWYYGYPGSLQGTIFGDYLPRVRKEIDFQPTYWTAGLDLGYSEAPTAHPTTMQLIAMDHTQTRFHAWDEYFHSNLEHKHKKIDDICLDIVNTAADWYMEYNMRTPLIINVDYGSGGYAYIDILKKTTIALSDSVRQYDTKKYNALQSISFIPVDKEIWFTRDRIDITHALMATGKLGITKERTPNLWKQMEQMVYKENRNKQVNKVEMLDLNDDCWDAMMYALMKYAKEAMLGINPLLRKGIV